MRLPRCCDNDNDDNDDNDEEDDFVGTTVVSPARSCLVVVVDFAGISTILD